MKFESNFPSFLCICCSTFAWIRELGTFSRRHVRKVLDKQSLLDFDLTYVMAFPFFDILLRIIGLKLKSEYKWAAKGNPAMQLVVGPFLYNEM